MALDYLLEFVYDETAPNDASVFIELRHNPPVYKAHVDKETYDVLSDGEKHVFLTALFDISGVTELSSRAYRIWLMKSPIFAWEEVLLPVLTYLKDWFQEPSLNQLPSSANPDGTGGFTLTNINQRRKT